MPGFPELRLAWCTYEAASVAVRRWHYSRSMPAGKMVRIGAWEDGEFRGAVIFSRGAARNIGRPFGLAQTEVVELTRVALGPHRTPTSRILSIAVRMLRRLCPGLKLIVSFADTTQGHYGGIYQAGGWLFVGTQTYHAFRVSGEVVHPRTLYSRFGVGGQSVTWLRLNVDPHAERFANGAKHKYLLPLTESLARSLRAIALPYPKRCADGVPGSTPGSPPGGGGSIPTSALSRRSHAWTPA